MALTEKQTQEVSAAGEAFLEKNKPSIEIIDKLDFAYRIENQSVFVLEIRPRWDKPSEIMETPMAKTTFVQTQNHWKVYWMRADLKWHLYSPKPNVKTIKAFFKLVDEDELACFFG